MDGGSAGAPARRSVARVTGERGRHRAPAEPRHVAAKVTGKTVRHRLPRGGDRAANAALHRIALVRMAGDPATKAYTARQRHAGKSNPEILRLLKRAIVREIHRALQGHAPLADIADLRPARQAKNITLTTVAEHFGVWPAHISTIERGTRRDDDLAQRYRAWLQAA